VANAALKLRVASEQNPTAKLGAQVQDWANLNTPKDTANLLAEARAIEPPDADTAESTIDRLVRQARWHREMAIAWNALIVIEAEFVAPDSPYDQAQKAAIQGIGLKKIDEDASPEPKRKAAEQSALEVKLEAAVALIKATFKGDDKTELEPDWAKASDEPKLPLALFVSFERQEIKPDPTKAKRPQPESKLGVVADKVRGPSALDHKGDRIPPAFDQTLRRDLAWTVATALASAAIYVPTIFNSTWGTWPDYVGALAAGFVGKAAISWAGLPFFESLSARGAAPAEPKKEAA
jgi:hypothetical protein